MNEHSPSARDRRMLEFAAEHRLILAAHAAALDGVSDAAAARRLRELTRHGYLRYRRELRGPGCYLIDRSGLKAIGSDLPRPRDLDLATYRHDAGLAWLWLAAHAGAFGPLDEVISERRMRSHDGHREPWVEPLGVRLGGVGPRGGERRHYPDLLLATSSGERVAVELELTTKPPRRREEILGGYAVEPRVDAVLYLVESKRVGRAIAASAHAVGIARMVDVRQLALDPRGARAQALHQARGLELTR
ncbi:MAG: hypothetical protein ACLPV4_16235 [Solirubrobacteraceae bacterium]